MAVNVAPRAGAWIETEYLTSFHHSASVAPRAGAWIETLPSTLLSLTPWSHPVRVRGLKQVLQVILSVPFIVAPRAGAWIETSVLRSWRRESPGRTPCGCVD